MEADGFRTWGTALYDWEGGDRVSMGPHDLVSARDMDHGLAEDIDREMAAFDDDLFDMPMCVENGYLEEDQSDGSIVIHPISITTRFLGVSESHIYRQGCAVLRVKKPRHTKLGRHMHHRHTSVVVETPGVRTDRGLFVYR